MEIPALGLYVVASLALILAQGQDMRPKGARTAAARFAGPELPAYNDVHLEAPI